MYLKGLDELDRKILDLLTQNARYTYSELGERLGLSRVEEYLNNQFQFLAPKESF